MIASMSDPIDFLIISISVTTDFLTNRSSYFSLWIFDFKITTSLSRLSYWVYL